MTYVFTKYGEVYAGALWNEMHLDNYTIVIQFSKIQEYRELPHNEKTIEKISEYGWVIANDAVHGTIEGENFDPQGTHTQGDSLYGGYDRKVMFVFGAGASANCVYGGDKEEFNQDVLRPPLGASLFDKRFKNHYSRYKGVKQSLTFLQGDNPDVEEMFEQEWKNISKENNEAVMKRHINIQYYLQEVLRDVTQKVTEDYFAKNLYARLANQLQKIHAASVKNVHGNHSCKKFAFVSFNQDTILDTFLTEQFNQPIAAMDDYVNINEKPFCLFKPHGSWDWGWQFPNTSQFGGKTADWLFDNKKSFFNLYFELLGNHIDMVDWASWGHEASLNKHHLGRYTTDKSQLKIIGNDNLNNYYPALLLPYRDKDEFTMPLKHFYNMQYYFSHVETLILIGWKGNEDAFNRQLLSHAHGIRKVIIADPNHKIVEKNLKELLSKPNIEKVFYKNFEDFVENGIEKEIK
ncbi:MAG: hypothetical protein RL708_2729 [Bacteroidota bacterium]